MRDRSVNLRTIAGMGSGLALMIVPGRLRWSRRSRRLLRFSAAGLISVPLIRRLFGWDVAVERVSAALIGLTLGGAQYLLSEEESSVRGAIATIGGLLVLSACVASGRPGIEERDA